MSNQQNAIYAILADSAYWDVRTGGTKPDDQENSNWTPIPKGWELVKEISGSGEAGRANNSHLEGFSARAYRNGNEIVIAYADKTNPLSNLTKVI